MGAFGHLNPFENYLFALLYSDCAGGEPVPKDILQRLCQPLNRLSRAHHVDMFDLGEINRLIPIARHIPFGMSANHELFAI